MWGTHIFKLGKAAATNENRLEATGPGQAENGAPQRASARAASTHLMLQPRLGFWIG
jgi:hypothetical protein